MKKLIVNADDFGLTPGVCDGILKSHREGIVTSTTILINTPHLDSTVEKLNGCPSLDLGLHLNITWGKPLLPAAKVKTLIGDDGLFVRDKNFDKVDPDEVGEEWNAQLAKAKSLGIKLTHLDTHHHTHLHPALLDLLPEIALREGLAVRSPAPWVCDFLKANGVRTPDHFIIDFYGEGKVSAEHLENLIRFLPDGFIEVMCHPAILDDELKKISSYREPRQGEVDTLTSPEVKRWLSENEITLSSFKDLPVPRCAPDKSCELIPPGDPRSSR